MSDYHFDDIEIVAEDDDAGGALRVVELWRGEKRIGTARLDEAAWAWFADALAEARRARREASLNDTD